jgi:hypothetical protein
MNKTSRCPQIAHLPATIQTAGSSGFTEFTEFANRPNYTYPDFPVKIDLISVSRFFLSIYAITPLIG